MDFINKFKNMFKVIKSLLDRKKFKEIVKKYFKLFTMTAFLCGFIYQVQIIYAQYMFGKTVIRLDIGGLSDDSPPAVTICFHKLFSMERAGKYNPGFKEIDKIYWKLQKNQSYGERDKLYLDSFRNYSDKHLLSKGLDLNELFDKMSIKYRALDGSQTIWLSLVGRMENETVPAHLKVTHLKTHNLYEYIGEPLESIVIRQFDKHFKSREESKCLTFFAHKEWRKFQLDTISIQFNEAAIFKSTSWYFNYYISIHSPNHLPDFVMQSRPE